ncbi:MAG: hypothetical protein ACLR9T_05365 [Thomasclavelia sp.]|mgnify:CR=1 FL=1|uniref:hypothetical protein n=1 Tax=Thomasclavelia sp. TaxID=3025757 RepID=UPI0039A13D44
MQEKELNKYIKGVYELESRVYKQQKLIQYIENEIKSLSDYEYKERFKTNKLVKEIRFYIYGVSFSLGPILGIMISFIINKQTVQLIDLVIWIIVCTLSLYAVLRWFYRVEIMIIKRNQKTDIQNNLDLEQLSLFHYNLKLAYIKTTITLKEYYNNEIIIPKYQNLIAISSFYDYFSSNKCTELIGIDGAYQIFENEKDNLITDIDVIKLNLEQLKLKQKKLYKVIIETNKLIKELPTIINCEIDYLIKI